MKKTLATLLILSSCHPALADTPCDYQHIVDTQFTKQIDKSDIIDRQVFPYVDDTRKCIMTLNVVIDGISYPSKGEFVFGPDMSENKACENATVRAKTSIIQQVSPEILSAATDMKCEQKDDMPVHIAAPKPESKVEKKEVVIAEAPKEPEALKKPVVTERIVQQPVVTERVVSRRVVHQSPTVVYVQPTQENWLRRESTRNYHRVYNGDSWVYSAPSTNTGQYGHNNDLIGGIIDSVLGGFLN